MCGVEGRRLVHAAVKSFKPRCDHSAHHPEVGIIICVDARLRAGEHHDYGDKALRFTKIAAVIPPYDRAPVSTRAEFSLAKLKDVDCLAVEGHSFCGGAQTAYAYPDPKDTQDEDIRLIVESVAESGADLPTLRDAFRAACEGNDVKGSNLLARHLVVQSVQNLSAYPGVNQKIIENTLDVVPLYHLLKQDKPGELSHLERYDVAHQRWIRADEDHVVTNMCARPHGCAQCVTCHHTIERSMQWVEHPIADNKTVLLPQHIAGLLRERMGYYQPRLAAQWHDRRDHGHLATRRPA